MYVFISTYYMCGEGEDMLVGKWCDMLVESGWDILVGSVCVVGHVGGERCWVGHVDCKCAEQVGVGYT